jgi:hypothetical protein
MGMVGTMETSSCHHSVDVVVLGAGYAGPPAASGLETVLALFTDNKSPKW